MTTFVMTAGSTLDFVNDWSDRLGADVIAASTWEIPSGLTKASESYGDTTATVWLSGGTAGSEYVIENEITTAAGRVLKDGWLLIVNDVGDVADTAALGFKARFPEFGVVSDALVGFALEEAGLAVGDNWPEAARETALRLYAAHILAVEGEPERSAEIAAATEAGETAQHSTRDVSSVKIGDTAWTYGNSSASGSGSAASVEDLSSTRYGRRFIETRDRYFVGVTTV